MEDNPISRFAYDVVATIEKTELLPPYFAVAQKALRLISDENVSIAALAATLESDQAMVSRLLGIINSAFFGVRHEVTRVERAINLLGLRETRNIVLSIATRDSLSRGQDRSTWLHSITCAHLAEALAKNSRREMDLNEAFSAGLLHDIGTAFLAKKLPAAVQEVQRWVGLGLDRLEAETRVLGYTHAEIGEMILRKLSVPQTIRDTVRYHHAPFDNPNPMNPVIALANQVAHLDSKKPQPVDERLLDYCRVKEGDLLDLNMAVQITVADLEQRLAVGSKG